MMSVTISTYKRRWVHLCLQLVVGGVISYLRYLCLIAYSNVCDGRWQTCIDNIWSTKLKTLNINI